MTVQRLQSGRCDEGNGVDEADRGSAQGVGAQAFAQDDMSIGDTKGRQEFDLEQCV